jgi:prevent-host-death family protein
MLLPGIQLESGYYCGYIFGMTASKSVLKNQLLELLRRLEETGEEIIVTDHNRPVATIQPWRERGSAEAVFGPWRGKLRVHADLTSPVGDDWEDA